MRAGVLAVLVTACAVLAALPGGSRAATSPGRVSCPLKAASGEAGAVEWAFTQTGPPSGAHPGVSSSYTHGRGKWSGGRGSGTACHEDSGGGKPARDLVLAVSGAAQLSPEVVRGGLPGVDSTC